MQSNAFRLSSTSHERKEMIKSCTKRARVHATLCLNKEDKSSAFIQSQPELPQVQSYYLNSPEKHENYVEKKEIPPRYSFKLVTN